MVARKLVPVLLATVVTSSVGCSGSRLRNMVGRSDYQSIEELESREVASPLASEQEAIAKYDADKRNETLASQTRELSEESEDDPDAIERQRKGFFDFAKIFNRKSDRDEFAPDPFAESANPVETVNKTEPRKPTAPAEQNVTKKSDRATKNSDFGSTIADVEKQAEAMFDEGLMKNDAIVRSTESFSKSVADVVRTESTQEQSFADFIKQQESAEETVVADVKEDLKSAILTDSKVEETTSRFDEFLNESPEASADPVVADESSELFPGLSKAFDEAFESADEEQPVGTEIADAVVTSSTFDETIETPFAKVQESSFGETTQKHGFRTNSKRDPWAEFSRTATNPVDERRTAALGDSDGFNWSRPQVSDQFESSATVTNSGNSDPFATNDKEFLQVSSTRTLDTQQPVDISDSMPLVIPGTSGIQNFDVSDSANHFDLADPAHVSNDPFLTSVPVFDDEPTSETVTDTAPLEAAPTVAAAKGGLLDWSRRTWFLLIGCIIVAFLLFMPDRHNRSNV